jgi:enamine deaminase RidA (YjgF/YER057c/UK114 family)
MMKRHVSQFLQKRFSHWGRWLISSLCIALVGVSVFAVSASAGVKPPKQVTFFGSPTSIISSGVAVPKRTAMYYTSGTVPPSTTGDTYTQAVGTLNRIKALLEAEGLSMSNVIYLTCYLVREPGFATVDEAVRKGFADWNRAYGEFFNNPTNPVKTARSTLFVDKLVNPAWFVEIEAIATYPN